MEHSKQHPVLSAFKFVFSLAVVTMLFWVCTSGDKKKEGEEGAPPFKMNCVILSKAQVKAWVDSGWTNPANPNRIKKLLLQFYSADAASAGNNMQLVSYPGKSMTQVQGGGKTILAIDTTCVAKTLAGPTAFANNWVDLDGLKIIKADGNLEEFDFVRFKPSTVHSPYISFDIEIVRLGVMEIYKGGGTWPCPPYCSIAASEESE